MSARPPHPPTPPAPPIPQADLRPPSQVMRLAQMGAMHPTRLSFIPSLLRELRNGKWTFARTLWEMDARGVGVGVYRASRPDGGVFSLVAFGHDLPPEKRSDRVIAEAWDATFALCEGEPSAEDVARLRKNAPLQEAGRCGPRELVLSRANKSARAFDHLVGRLRDGSPPDRELLESVGYLMRTTAVYGNGKFGLADRDPRLRPQMRPPFRAEMLAVWLIRVFTFDWAEHVGGGKIPPDIKRTLGLAIQPDWGWRLFWSVIRFSCTGGCSPAKPRWQESGRRGLAMIPSARFCGRCMRRCKMRNSGRRLIRAKPGAFPACART